MAGMVTERVPFLALAWVLVFSRLSGNTGFRAARAEDDGNTRVTVQISNGIEAPYGSFPYAAALMSLYPIDIPNDLYQYCGGTLISKYIVMTAAHCTFDRYGQARFPAWISIGRTDIKDTSTGVTAFQVDMIRHPEYDPDTMANDVALFILDQAYTKIKPVKLAKAKMNLTAGAPLTVVGWGTMPNKSLSRKLLYTNLTFVDRPACDSFYEVAYKGFTPDNTTLCAGSTGQSDSCIGDSGGPLLTPNGIQVGIVSFGPSQCGGVGNIGGYTDVRAVRKWINGHVKEENAKRKKLGWKDAEGAASPAASDKPFSRKLKAAAGDL